MEEENSIDSEGNAQFIESRVRECNRTMENEIAPAPLIALVETIQHGWLLPVDPLTALWPSQWAAFILIPSAFLPAIEWNDGVFDPPVNWRCCRCVCWEHGSWSGSRLRRRGGRWGVRWGARW